MRVYDGVWGFVGGDGVVVVGGGGGVGGDIIST